MTKHVREPRNDSEIFQAFAALLDAERNFYDVVHTVCRREHTSVRAVGEITGLSKSQVDRIVNYERFPYYAERSNRTLTGQPSPRPR